MLSNFLVDYKNYIRDFCIEEPLDFFIYRPLGFSVVKVLAWFKLPLNPNHLSLMALISGLGCSSFILFGGENFGVWAAIFLFLFCVFDCCDGLWARMFKNGSPLGSFIDQGVDALVGASIILSLMARYPYDSLMIFLAGLSLLFHFIIYNFYKKQYIHYKENTSNGHERELQHLEKYSTEHEHSFLKKFFIEGFVKFLRLQQSSQQSSEQSSQQSKKGSLNYERESYLAKNKKVLMSWGLISGSGHLTLLMFCFLFQTITPFLVFSLFIGNALAFILFHWQKQVNDSLETIENIESFVEVKLGKS
jgi:phosphatidylglycerophosphate synthase